FFQTGSAVALLMGLRVGARYWLRCDPSDVAAWRTRMDSVRNTRLPGRGEAPWAGGHRARPDSKPGTEHPHFPSSYPLHPARPPPPPSPLRPPTQPPPPPPLPPHPRRPLELPPRPLHAPQLDEQVAANARQQVVRLQRRLRPQGIDELESRRRPVRHRDSD